ncbi:hypothetical protein BWQ96_04736 [Gracilariopsis chorda]|uniref:Uncharacterized protein n=1 Tax=Gracilariopsis chorda TaxID=448386 RepID=A0A2V3ITU4_9FLOR|nr:hypothetical protein BWQ96_04736 [Gracilariopsis chorda]|eukprot:PXF45534.1 hypothetical protein BWQ96_04736 [Gracilariopsis chorda]
MASPAPPSPLHQPSPAAMVRRYERAIKENNDPKAMVDLGLMMLKSGSGIKPDPSRGIQLLERAIKQGNSIRAMWTLGTYLYDEGNRAERHRGISLLERASTLVEHPEVWYNLAFALVYPRCSIKRQPVRAAQLLRRALRLGENTKCMWLLGDVLLHEQEVQPDTAYAISLLKRVIEITNDAEKMYTLGCIFSKGSAHLLADKRRAVHWYARAILTGNHTEAKFHMAVTITRNPKSIPPDPVVAKSLLKEVLTTATHRDAISVLTDLLYGWKQTRDFAFAASLSDFAVRKFDCTDSMYRLGIILSINAPNVPVNFPYAVSLFERCYRSTGNGSALIRGIEILSYGAPGFPAKRELARDLLAIQQSEPDSEKLLLSSMLRVGVQGVVEADRKRAYELLRDYADAGNLYVTMNHAMFMSEESGGNSCITIDYKEAAALLNSRYDRRERHLFSWTPLSLPGLNLAALLLEGHQITPDDRDIGTGLLYELLETDLGDLAAINLGYLVWHGICGVPQNRKDAVKLYEFAFVLRPGAIAGALLAGALANDTDETAADVERAVKLWRWVRIACEQEGAELDEFERVCKVMSEDMVASLEEATARFDAEGKDLADLVVEEEESRFHLGVDDVQEILRLHREYGA